MSLPPHQPTRPASLRAAVDRAVGDVLARTPSLRGAPPELRQRLAERMSEISMVAATQIAEESRLTQEIRDRTRRPRASALRRPAQPGTPRRSALARPLSAGDQFSGTAARQGAEQLRALRDAIDFPTYVQSLITGVFNACTRSSLQQLEALNEMLMSVSASASAFTTQNIGDGAAARWVVGRLPYFQIVASEGGDRGARLRLREDVDLSERYEELKEVLEADNDEVEAIDEDELEETLLPLVRRKMGRDKQAMLATLVMLGMQRVVVDEGRLHASMDMRVDTRSISEQREQDRFDSRVNTAASASVGAGPWAASASVSATVGYVRSDDQYTREEMASQAGLRSSVDLVFRTEQVPLDRMANDAAQQRLMSRTNVPATNWSQGSLLGTETRTTRREFGEVPDAPPLPEPPPIRRADGESSDSNASETGDDAGPDDDGDSHGEDPRGSEGSVTEETEDASEQGSDDTSGDGSGNASDESGNASDGEREGSETPSGEDSTGDEGSENSSDDVMEGTSRRHSGDSESTAGSDEGRNTTSGDDSDERGEGQESFRDSLGRLARNEVSRRAGAWGTGTVDAGAVPVTPRSQRW